MPLTIAEKILSSHAGKKELRPGEIVIAEPDVLLANDVTAPLAIKIFSELGGKKILHPERIVLVLDHFTPNRDLAAAEACAEVRRFARKHHLPHFFESGEAGIEHALLPEQGLVLPGQLVIGADSHTCTYGALGAFASGVGSTDFAVALKTGRVWLKVPESIHVIFSGSLAPFVGGKDLILYLISRLGVEGANSQVLEFSLAEGLSLRLSDRLTISNMAVEAGAKAGIFAPDRITEEYLAGKTEKNYTIYSSDRNAAYRETLKIDVTALAPQVALPSSPANAVPVEAAPEVKLDQVVIGSCTNGWIEDLRTAAQILVGHRTAPGLRLIILPATPAIYRQALREGLIETFLSARAVIAPPSCGPCLGGHLCVIAAGEQALATTNRNFPGRMGHPDSRVFLSGPAVAAASAITGRITHPREIVSTPPAPEAK